MMFSSVHLGATTYFTIYQLYATFAPQHEQYTSGLLLYSSFTPPPSPQQHTHAHTPLASQLDQLDASPNHDFAFVVYFEIFQIIGNDFDLLSYSALQAALYRISDQLNFSFVLFLRFITMSCLVPGFVCLLSFHSLVFLFMCIIYDV